MLPWWTAFLAEADFRSIRCSKILKLPRYGLSTWPMSRIEGVRHWKMRSYVRRHWQLVNGGICQSLNANSKMKTLDNVSWTMNTWQRATRSINKFPKVFLPRAISKRLRNDWMYCTRRSIHERNWRCKGRRSLHPELEGEIEGRRWLAIWRAWKKE